MSNYLPDPAVLAAAARNAVTDRAHYERQRAADAAEETTDRLTDLLDAMTKTLAIAEQARADAERSERHSRIMSWSSVALAVASLTAAVVAIFIGA